ncbi:hypothetical protein E2C01_093228 [Portunus trituberculatus]|uniref:Uncharacterized protein n=1 Tax=Portunus trituberculatus TaxID=210409 RepID=A0A5B7JM77_PORTR|nr:hypothetical protein [Portunus trituberculatus]
MPARRTAQHTLTHRTTAIDHSSRAQHQRPPCYGNPGQLTPMLGELALILIRLYFVLALFVEQIDQLHL